MELLLQRYIAGLEVVSDAGNLSEETPQVMRRTNPSVGKTSTFVCALLEPWNMILPLNVIWIDFNPNSDTYRHALRRVSKDADPQNVDRNHTWEVLYYLEHIWVEQYYDADDLAAIGSGETAGAASTTEMGIVLISHDPAEGQTPIAIVEGDPRLTDAREALPHSHAEIPATELQHADGVVAISNGTPEVGSVLKASSPTSAGWSKLMEADITPANP